MNPGYDFTDQVALVTGASSTHHDGRKGIC
jgi:hypothetical protein